MITRIPNPWRSYWADLEARKTAARIAEQAREDARFEREYQTGVYAETLAEEQEPEPDLEPEHDPDERAWALLRANLTPAQKRSLTQHGYFHVKGSVSGWRYRIHGNQGSVGNFNIERLDALGNAEKVICFEPEAPKDSPYELPPGDIMLAQKITIETDELAMFRVANVEDA